MKSDVVFSYGDFANEFYFILKGKVSVRVPTTIKVYFEARHQFLSYLGERYKEVIWKGSPDTANPKLKQEVEEYMTLKAQL